MLKKRFCHHIVLLLWLFLLLGPSKTSAKQYNVSISNRTPKESRRWGGLQSVTGNNLGGWLVRIMNDGNFACGGSYYAPLLVITSANCMQPYRYSLEGVSVDATALLRTEEEKFALVETVYTPDGFKYLQNPMDIAIVRLKSPIKGLLTEFIELCNVPLVPGMRMIAVGWGHDSLEVQKLSWEPSSGTVPVEDFKKCKMKYPVRSLTDTSFCVTQPDDKTKCLYDGGCPLVYKNQLCGVVSYGPVCENSSNPGIYTDINKVKDYIEDVESRIDFGIWSYNRGLGKYIPIRLRTNYIK